MIKPTVFSIVFLGVFSFISRGLWADQWVALFYHIHTNYSTEELQLITPIKLTVSEVQKRAGDFCRLLNVPGATAITDHNNWDAADDPDFKPSGVVKPICGIEWAVGLGEVTVLGNLEREFRASMKRGDSTDKFLQYVDKIHSQGGVITVCHPRAKVRWHSDQRLGVDGIEVWNGPTWKVWDQDALNWWHQLLVNGERITAMGASDAHTIVHPMDCAMSLVYAKSNEPDDVLNAVKAGRVMVLGSSKAPRIYLTADSDNDGEYDDAVMGDILPADYHNPVKFKITIENATDTHRLVLLDRNGIFYNERTGTGKGWKDGVYSFERSFKKGVWNFVRAEVRKCDNVTMESLTNPIYIPVIHKPAR